MHFLIEGECEQERTSARKQKTRITKGSSQGGAQMRAGGQKARKRKRVRRANAVLKGTTQATAGEWANGRATS